MKVGVVGVGYMGAVHATKYRSVEGADLVAVVDTDSARAQQVATACQCRWFPSIDEMLDANLGVEAVSIATPTASHLDVATRFLEEGVHCLVEKPLASTSSEAARLEELASRRGCALIPGHIERFNPAVVSLPNLGCELQYLRAYRVGPTRFRSLDVEVVSDVMIHDLDLALFLSGAVNWKIDLVRAIAADDGILDLVNAHLRIGDRCVVDVTASRLAIARRRKMRLIAGDYYYSIDCGRRTAISLSRPKYTKGIAQLKMQQDTGREPTAEEVFEALGATRLAEPGIATNRDPMEAQLEHFLSRARGDHGISVVSAMDGVRAVRLCEDIVREAKSQASPLLGPRIRT